MKAKKKILEKRKALDVLWTDSRVREVSRREQTQAAAKLFELTKVREKIAWLSLWNTAWECDPRPIDDFDRAKDCSGDNYPHKVETLLGNKRPDEQQEYSRIKDLAYQLEKKYDVYYRGGTDVTYPA